MLNKLAVFLVMLSALALTACTDKKDNEIQQNKILRLACMAYNEPEIQAGVLDLEKLGYEVKIVILQNATIMCEALDNNEIDAALHPHKPWIDSYNKNKHKNIVMLTPYIHKNVFAMFSTKHKNVDQIQEGARIGIPQDESNMSRSLFLLEQLDFIKLRTGVDNPTDIDIEENKKHIEIIKLDVHQVISAIRDVDAVCSAKLFLISNGVPTDTEIVKSNDLDTFGVGFIVSNSNRDSEWSKDLLKAYTTNTERTAINALYKGGSVPGF